MRVNPISAEEAEATGGSFEPWPDGVYDFVVAEAIDDISKAGNEQIKLTLHVFNRAGTHRIVYDYLPSSDAAQWKVRNFADAMGLLRQYDSGNLNPHDMMGKPGRLNLRTQAAGGGFGAQNKVGSYIVAKKAATELAEPSRAARAKAPAIRDLDDEIPF